MATSVFLQKMGFNKCFPRAVAFGPVEMGGLALRDLAVEQGILQIRRLPEHIYHQTEAGDLLLISLQYLQMEAGTVDHILEHPLSTFSYITPCWLSSIRTFLW